MRTKLLIMAACAVGLWACDNNDDGGMSGLRLEPSELGVLKKNTDTVAIKTNVSELMVETFAYPTPIIAGAMNLGTWSRAVDELLTPGHDVECCDWLKLSIDEQKTVYVITETQYVSSRDLAFTIELSHNGDRCVVSGVKPVDETAADGYTEDVIELSSRNMEFTASGGTCEVTAKGRNWWLLSVEFDGNGIFHKIKDSASSGDVSGSFKIDWLTITYRDRTTITITAEPNTTGVERSFDLTLEDCNYFDHIWGHQAAE